MSVMLLTEPLWTECDTSQEPHDDVGTSQSANYAH